MSINQFISNTKEALSIKPFQSNSVTEQKRLVKFVLASSAVAMLALEPSVAAAAGASQSAEAMLSSIVTFFSGGIARMVAILAIVMLGFMALVGKLDWGTAGKVILGIVLIFSAATIAQTLGGW